MNDKIFLDTNILIYIYSFNKPNKQIIARELVNKNDVIISTQVINELVNVLYKKFKINWENIIQTVNEYENNFFINNVTLSEITKACEIAKKYQFSYYDSLIISTALNLNCSVLYSEDLNSNQLINNKLKIINPFQYIKYATERRFFTQSVSFRNY